MGDGGEGAAALPHEATCHREDGVAALPRLHRARAEGAAFAHAFHVVDDGDAGVAGEHEEAVVRVYDEVVRDCALGRLVLGRSCQLMVSHRTSGHYVCMYMVFKACTDPEAGIYLGI